MEFEKFPKIPRYKRNIIITEKLDGTNAQVAVERALPGDIAHNRDLLLQAKHADVWYNVYAGSHNRWLHISDDNAGFAAWVASHAVELVEGLGEGRHYGEWWGQGIQRRYGLDHKRFSLFNTGRWLANPDTPQCCHVVPLLYAGGFEQGSVEYYRETIKRRGSFAAPGFMNPEGIVIYHTAGRNLYKVTLDGDAAKGE